MAYVIVAALLSVAAVAVLSYLYHSKVAAKVADVKAEIEWLEKEAKLAEVSGAVVVQRIKSLL